MAVKLIPLLLFKNSDPSKKTHRITITKVSLLIEFAASYGNQHSA